MSRGIIIIGSGFAARQLVKNIRKQDAHVPLTLIAADTTSPISATLSASRSAPMISPAS